MDEEGFERTAERRLALSPVDEDAGSPVDWTQNELCASKCAKQIKEEDKRHWANVGGEKGGSAESVGQTTVDEMVQKVDGRCCSQAQAPGGTPHAIDRLFL